MRATAIKDQYINLILLFIDGSTRTIRMRNKIPIIINTMAVLTFIEIRLGLTLFKKDRLKIQPVSPKTPKRITKRAEALEIFNEGDCIIADPG